MNSFLLRLVGVLSSIVVVLGLVWIILWLLTQLWRIFP